MLPILTNMKTNVTYPFFFALLLSKITCGAAQNSSEFDHFWLVQVWPHGYCLEIYCFRRTSIFVLHGLWPVDYTENTLEGTNKSEPGILASLKSDEALNSNLTKYWTSLGTKFVSRFPLFWIYEWEKHGSAQKVIEPLDYFQRAVELTKTTDLLNTLAQKGILANGNSYPKDKYKKAIKAKIGYTPSLGCVRKGGHFQLKEVTICVDAQARNFRRCNNLYRDSCWAKKIKFPAPT